MVKGEVSSNKIMACHCTDCQKFSGAPLRAVAVITADDMKIPGTVTEFLKIAKLLLMICTGCFYQRHELATAKHISSKSAIEWVGKIADSSWVAERPASGVMTP